MKIEQPYKNFNNIQRAAARFGVYDLFHKFMTRHCQCSFDKIDALCLRFLLAAKEYFYSKGSKKEVLRKALSRFLLEY